MVLTGRFRRTEIALKNGLGSQSVDGTDALSRPGGAVGIAAGVPRTAPDDNLKDACLKPAPACSAGRSAG